MTPKYEFVNPSFIKMMNIGIPVTCKGTIMLAKNRTKIVFLNLKSNFAKTNAARLDEMSVNIVELKLTITLLKNDLIKGSCVKTLI